MDLMRTRAGFPGPALWSTLITLSLTLLLPGPRARAQTNDEVQHPEALKRMSLEELFDLEVTTVSQRPESLSKTAAAVHVVTQDDLRRIGAQNIPEALRDIPGVEVARIDSRQYAVTARGFNGSVANKLLVLVDGRSVYTPLFSGVFWDEQDVFMEDVEQIEVVRGPGATVWGANAVNGVINVITKNARDTQGLLAMGGGGNAEQGFGGARYGGTIGTTGFFRVYGKHLDREAAIRPDGTDAGDDYRMTQGGFRVDWSAAAADFSLQGDAYGGSAHQPTTDDIELSGGNAVAHWTRRLSATSNLQLLAYYDRTDRDIPSVFREILDTYDVQLHHRFAPLPRHDFVWGLGFRYIDDDVGNSPTFAFLPPRVWHRLFSGFLQDELTLMENRLRLTLGSKIEHNDYTGTEYLPSGRLAWTPTAAHTVWAAVSRAVRTPSRIDRDLFVPESPPYLLAGGSDFQSEVLQAYELGYRVQGAHDVTASLATFYNDYDKLRSLEAGPPAYLANGLEGRSYGVETEATWQASEWCRLEAGYTLQRLELERKPGSTDLSQAAQEGDSPRHRTFVRSTFVLPHDLDLDLTLRYSGELPHQQVPDNLDGDVHLGWRPTPTLDLGIYGRSLFDPRHVEFGTPASRREVERSVWGKATCRF